jgi:hypothetical protein
LTIDVLTCGIEHIEDVFRLHSIDPIIMSWSPNESDEFAHEARTRTEDGVDELNDSNATSTESESIEQLRMKATSSSSGLNANAPDFSSERLHKSFPDLSEASLFTEHPSPLSDTSYGPLQFANYPLNQSPYM